MLSVTDSALDKLQNSLQPSNDNSKCFRIVPKDHATVTLRYMEYKDSDETFDKNGRTVLALPED